MSVFIHNSYAPEYTANNPVIGWNSATMRGTPSASSSAAGYSFLNPLDPSTTNYWRPDANPSSTAQTWTISLASEEAFTYCGIAAHNLGSTGCTVTVEGHDGTSWETLAGPYGPEDDSAIMILFGEYETDQIRISLADGIAPSVGVIMFGDVLEFPRRVYQGYTPIDMATDATFVTNYTRGGQLGGRSVQFTGSSSSFTVNNLPETWVRDSFKPFMDYSLYRPFFLAERPEDYPDAVEYMMTTEPIKPTRTGPRNFMSVTI